MFIYQTEEDKYGKSQVHYWLTQGDTCGIISTPKNEDGTIVDPALISVVKFKLYKNDNTRECVFQKNMTITQTNKYLFKFLSSENTLPLGKYKYEIEYTFDDGDVNTPNQWYFEIIEQAV